MRPSSRLAIHTILAISYRWSFILWESSRYPDSVLSGRVGYGK